MMPSTLCTGLLLLPLFLQAPDQESIDTLIKKLGSPRFRERESATQRLLNKMPDAIPALKRALQSTEPEVSRRAAHILEEYEKRQLRRSLKRLQLFIEKGKVDLVVQLLAHWPKGKYEKACWHEVRKLTCKLSLSHKWPKESLGTWLENQPQAEPIVISSRRVTKNARRLGDAHFRFVFVRASEVNWANRKDAGFTSGSLIFAADKVQISTPYDHCEGVILSGGPVVLDCDVQDSIIVADGKVVVTGYITNCVIVTRDKIQYYKAPSGPSTMVEEQMQALGFIQFFDPTKEGITVEQVKNAVRIKQVTAKKPYAKAGLKKGDVITSINGAKVTSPENFRRVLRKHVAWEEEMTFRVVRDGKELQIKLRPLVLPPG